MQNSNGMWGIRTNPTLSRCLAQMVKAFGPKTVGMAIQANPAPHAAAVIQPGAIAHLNGVVINNGQAVGGLQGAMGVPGPKGDAGYGGFLYPRQAPTYGLGVHDNLGNAHPEHVIRIRMAGRYSHASTFDPTAEIHFSTLSFESTGCLYAFLTWKQIHQGQYLDDGLVTVGRECIRLVFNTTASRDAFENWLVGYRSRFPEGDIVSNVLPGIPTGEIAGHVVDFNINLDHHGSHPDLVSILPLWAWITLHCTDAVYFLPGRLMFASATDAVAYELHHRGT